MYRMQSEISQQKNKSIHKRREINEEQPQDDIDIGINRKGL